MPDGLKVLVSHRLHHQNQKQGRTLTIEQRKGKTAAKQAEKQADRYKKTSTYIKHEWTQADR